MFLLLTNGCQDDIMMLSEKTKLQERGALDPMFVFIEFLRALATCLITNSHYTGIYPSDIIANGGMIGNVIFFAVSGYCLYNVKGSFLKWYPKRVLRCYIPVILITAIYMLIGFYSLSEHSWLHWYIYPTAYHFVSSIVLLYIPFYVIMRIPALKERILWVMLALLGVLMLVYVVFYDKSYYHIDTVREPMIRFLFMECMLLGAYFKQREEKVLSVYRAGNLIGMAIFLVVYFASKMLFSKMQSLSVLQILNWFTIFGLLYFIFALFAGLESKLSATPRWIKALASYLAAMTLEIYVVQSVLIDLIRAHLSFPLNWFALTASILVAATILHFVSGWVIKGIDSVCMVIAGKKKNQ